MKKLAAKLVLKCWPNLLQKDPVMSALCKLACSDNNLDICDTSKLPGVPLRNATKIFPMNWRHFSTLDPQVN